MDSSGTATDISGATTAAYTPTADDRHAVLKVTANYSDAHGAAKSASGETTTPVSIAQQTLLSNLDQAPRDPATHGTIEVVWAQRFTTGSSASGYGLTAVEAFYLGGPLPRIEIRAATGRRPRPSTSVLARLVTHDTVEAFDDSSDPIVYDNDGSSQKLMFVPESSVQLRPNTTYFVVLSSEDGGSGTHFKLARLTGVDADGESDWSFSSGLGASNIDGLQSASYGESGSPTGWRARLKIHGYKHFVPSNEPSFVESSLELSVREDETPGVRARDAGGRHAGCRRRADVQHRRH